MTTKCPAMRQKRFLKKKQGQKRTFHHVKINIKTPRKYTKYTKIKKKTIALLTIMHKNINMTT